MKPYLTVNRGVLRLLVRFSRRQSTKSLVKLKSMKDNLMNNSQLLYTSRVSRPQQMNDTNTKSLVKSVSGTLRAEKQNKTNDKTEPNRNFSDNRNQTIETAHH